MSDVDIVDVLGWLETYLGNDVPFVSMKQGERGVLVMIDSVHREKFIISEDAFYISVKYTDEIATFRISIVTHSLDELKYVLRQRGDMKRSLDAKLRGWLLPPKVHMSDDEEHSNSHSESSQAVESSDPRSDPDESMGNSSSMGESDSRSLSHDNTLESIHRMLQSHNHSQGVIVNILHAHEEKIDRIIKAMEKLLDRLVPKP